MIEPKLLAILRCPISGEKLQNAEKTLLERLNVAIEEGRIRDRADQRIEQPVEEGLVTPGGGRLYAIRQQIPVMIADESIDLSQLKSDAAET